MHQIELSLNDKTLPLIAKAMGNQCRLAIMALLDKKPMGINQLAQELHLSQPAVSQHVEILRKAGLVLFEHVKKDRYSLKHVRLCYDSIHLRLASPQMSEDIQVLRCDMPIGAFVNASIRAPCGMCDPAGYIKTRDYEQVFNHPERLKAQSLWLGSGYLEYRFPRDFPKGVEVLEVIFSAEISSEASLPIGHTECPSDITLWINNIEVGTWTCPGFFTGTRGRYTPDWLSLSSNQYGLLKTWYITLEGSRVDGTVLSDITPNDLNLFNHKYILVRVGHKSSAKNKNGIQLFGSHFGNYPQDLVFQIKYRPLSEGTPVPHQDASNEIIITDRKIRCQ